MQHPLIAKMWPTSLSIGKKKKHGVGKTGDDISHPSMWSISYDQLMDLRATCCAKRLGNERYMQMTMRDINRTTVS